MEIKVDNRKIIKFLEMLDGFLSNDFLRQIKVFNLNQKHLEISNILLSDAISVIHKLIDDGYLVKLTIEQTDIIGDKIAEKIEQNTEKEIATGEYTEEYAYKLAENMFIEHGIDIKKIENDAAESKTVFEILDDNKEIVGNHILERIIKSPLIGVFFIQKDIFILLEILKRDINYDDIDHKNFPPKFDFNTKTSTLSIHNIGSIQIANDPEKPNKSHYLLEYIFNNGIDETHQYKFIHKEGLFAKPSEKYEDIKDIYKRYKSPAEYINKIIKEKYGIDKFLRITTKSVSIIYSA